MISFFQSLLLLCFVYTNAVIVVPEQANIEHVNPKYARDAKFSVTRVSRRDSYSFNLYGTILHPWGNNITVDLIFYEFLRNEFRRSFVEMHFKLCDLINSDPFIGKTLFNALGLKDHKCPIPVGFYNLSNMIIDFGTNFVWPFQKCKVEGTLKQTPTKEVVAIGYAIINLKAERKKKTNKKKSSINRRV